MYTMLPYALFAFKAAFFMRTIGVGTFWFVVIHFCLLYGTVGWNMIGHQEGIIYYPIIWLLHTLAGRMLAKAFNTASCLAGMNYLEAQLRSSVVNRTNKLIAESWKEYLLRWVKLFLLFALMFGGIAIFEYTHVQDWFGWILCAVVFVLVDVLFVYLFRPTFNIAELTGWNWWTHDTFFVVKNDDGSPSWTLIRDICICFVVYDLVTIVSFGPCLSVTGPHWWLHMSGIWQFWPLMASGAAFTIAFFVLKFVFWMWGPRSVTYHEESAPLVSTKTQ